MPSSKDNRASPRVAVIGGGITGLAAAHRLRELDENIEVALLEAGAQLGGVLRTSRQDGYLIEHAADNFITNLPWAVDLCRRIGFDDQLTPTDERFRKAFVVHRGKLFPVPDGFALMAPARIWPVMTTPILSWRGKLRLAWEYFVPPKTEPGDESLESFAVRRLGRQAYERIVQPLVGGIYTADPQRLSLAATLPRFLEMEREHGGLIRGALRQGKTQKQSDRTSSGARYSLFVAPRDGMASLVDAIATRLPEDCIRWNTRVQELSRDDDSRWRLHLSGEHETQTFDQLIVATPAPAAAKLLQSCDRQLAGLLAEIPYAGASVVCLGYRREQIEHPLNGFGFVVPAAAGRKILSASFSSIKYPGRAPQGRVLIRVFVGGALQPELVSLPDDELKEIARRELAELIGARGGPELCHVARWEGAMPQYHLGHPERVAQIESRTGELTGLEIAGNAYRGVGVPQCIRSGQQAAERVHAALVRRLQSSPDSS